MLGSSISKTQDETRSCFTGLGTPSLSAVSVPGKPPLLIRGHWNTLDTEPGSICGIYFNFLCFWLEYGSCPKRVTVTGTRNHCYSQVTMPRLWKLNLEGEKFHKMATYPHSNRVHTRRPVTSKSNTGWVCGPNPLKLTCCRLKLVSSCLVAQNHSLPTKHWSQPTLCLLCNTEPKADGNRSWTRPAWNPHLLHTPSWRAQGWKSECCPGSVADLAAPF